MSSKARIRLIDSDAALAVLVQVYRRALMDARSTDAKVAEAARRWLEDVAPEWADAQRGKVTLRK